MQPDNLHSIRSADFAFSYVNKKVNDAPIEPEEIKSYTVPIYNINDAEPNLKNELREIQKCSRPCVISFHKVNKFKSPGDRYLILLQLCCP